MNPNDDLFNYLVATDELDDFLGYKGDEEDSTDNIDDLDNDFDEDLDDELDDEEDFNNLDDYIFDEDEEDDE